MAIRLSVKVLGVANVRRAMRGMTAGLAASTVLTAGTSAVNIIRERTRKGRGIDGTLSPYLSSGVKRSGATRARGATPDLTDLGKMLSQLKYNTSQREIAIAPGGDRDRIGEFIHRGEGKGGEGNNPKGRAWLGIGPSDQTKLDKSIAAAAILTIRDNRGSAYVVDGKPIQVAGKVTEIKNP